jgi:hypothetical protein
MAVMRRACVAAGIALGAGTAHAAESDYLDRFRGSWTGSGRVQREGTSSPRQVTCSLTGRPGENRLLIQGSCRAAVILSRPVGADLTFDPRAGIYRGVYTGSRIGPAQLTGTRSGDAVKLRIDWPRLVNGDTQASMVIRNDGRGALQVIVLDNLTPGGPDEQTSVIVLQRR